jgi:hypothetical protein
MQDILSNSGNKTDTYIFTTVSDTAVSKSFFFFSFRIPFYLRSLHSANFFTAVCTLSFSEIPSILTWFNKLCYTVYFMNFITAILNVLMSFVSMS